MRFTLSILLLLSLQGFFAHSKVLIVTMAQVKSHVITSREVEIHSMLDKALGNRFKNFKAAKPVEQIIREWLLYYEASTFYNTPIDKTKINKSILSANERLKKSVKWKDLSISSGELREKLKRRLEADRLYLFKKKASVLPVSSSDVETEYIQNRIRYGNLSFEEVKEKIRKNKIDKNLHARLEQWFLVLEKKYKVQRFSKFNKQ